MTDVLTEEEPFLLQILSKGDEEDGLVSSWSPENLSVPLLAPANSEQLNLPKSPGRRKISESRGVTLPDIKLHQQVSTLVNFGDEIVESPPPTSSPLGHFLSKPQWNRSPKLSEKLKTVLGICIFLPDQRGIQFNVEGGRFATAEQLSRLLWNHLNLKPQMASEMFALWMCSPLLEVQLKPHHNPLEVRKYWPDLLRRFTTSLEEERERDEPLLMVKRNVLLSKYRQLQLINQVGEKAEELLFLEARECILNGRYLCPLNLSIHLAAINMVMNYGPCKLQDHNADFVRHHLQELMPSAHLSVTKSLSVFGWIIPGCKGLENEFLTMYQEMSKKSPKELRKLYLDICLQLPTYGALFRGQIERPTAVPMKDLFVNIAISREFVCVVDPDKYLSLLTVPVNDCSWRKLNSSNAQCLSSFFVHFINQNENDNSSKLLQIFTKQAVMMDALMNSCVQAWRNEDNDDAFAFDDEETLKIEDASFAMCTNDPLYQTKCNRLCLATFDSDGNCVEAGGSLKMVVDVAQ